MLDFVVGDVVCALDLVAENVWVLDLVDGNA
jgi:hypothetical protein